MAVYLSVWPAFNRPAKWIRLLEVGYDISMVKELLGHKDVKTTMIYTHVLYRGPARTGLNLYPYIRLGPRKGGIGHFIRIDLHFNRDTQFNMQTPDHLERYPGFPWILIYTWMTFFVSCQEGIWLPYKTSGSMSASISQQIVPSSSPHSQCKNKLDSVEWSQI